MNSRTNLSERYRTGAIISYVLLIATLVMLFITLWNKLTLNPVIHIGNLLYFLLLITGLLSTALFILFLALNSTIPPSARDIRKPEAVEENVPSQDNKPQPFNAPFEVDIDILADKIVPKPNPRETLENYTEKILINLAREFEFTQGVFFIKNPVTGAFEARSTYAWASINLPGSFVAGEGLNGQVAKDKKILYLNNIPDGYVNVVSGLGEGKACHLIIIPLLLNKESFGIIELTSFRLFNDEFIWTMRNIAKIISNVMVTKIRAKEPEV